MTAPIDSSDQFNPWYVPEGGFPSAEDDAGRSPLQVETIENVEPLDRQFGIQPKKTVPDVLYDTLFGQPDPTEAEIQAAGGNAVTPVQTYAVLDAAKVENLPELLGASGLEHRCLFTGDAYDEMKDAAPWVVRLEDGNGFTRRLFTGSEGINGLWDKQAGVYVRSRGTLDDMWRHFRKFTRVRDEAGKWFYFRFWEPRAANAYFRHAQSDEDRILRWFYVGRTALSVLVVDTETKALAAFIPALSNTDKRPNSPFVYGEHERAALRQGKINQYENRLRSHLNDDNAAYAKLQENRQKELVKTLIAQAGQYGIRSEKSIADFAAASLRYKKPLEDNPRMEQVLRSSMHEADKIKELITLVNQKKAY